MDYLHQLLKRQIKRHLGSLENIPEKCHDLLLAISEAYTQSDEGRRLLERAMEISSEELMEANAEMRTILGAIPDEFLHITHLGQILYYQKGNRNLLSTRSRPVLGHNINDFLPVEARPLFQQALKRVQDFNNMELFELGVPRDLDEDYFEVRILPLRGEHCVILIRDISERKAFEKHTAYLAFHDSLTGLPNRLMFQDRLRQAISYANRHKTMFAVMFLDLDRFKQINDTLGHSAGDDLLITISQRLRHSLRQTDTVAKLKSDSHESVSSHTIARLGGDEFTLILSDIREAQDVSRVARRILQEVSRPLHLSGEEVYTSASIGIAMYPHDGQDLDTLIKNADAAMYHAKEKGRNNFQLYSPSMNAAAVQRMAVENSLRRSVKMNELSIYYQPQFELEHGRIVGLEALLRWNHPKYGLVSPKYFIPLAEESDLILSMGKWVIQTVCQQYVAWRELGLPEIPIFINVSGHQLQDESLLRMIARNLAEYNIPSTALGVEFTETALMKNPSQAAHILQRLQENGIKISMDDFGTGYSSLSYLKRFSLDCIKLDQSFTADVLSDPDDAILARTIINMGQNLGLCVVAEGIESGAQLTWLQECNCHLGQGYHLCPPLPPQSLLHFIEKYEPRLFPRSYEELFGIAPTETRSKPNLTPLPLMS